MVKLKPNLFIVGAPKAGTTSLYYYLSQHSQIFMSKIKEPNYFSKVPKSDLTITIENGKEYLDLFSKCKNETIIGEASTTYLYFDGTAEKIKSFNKNSKIIISLREPISRAFSHYLMDKDYFGCEDKDVSIALKDETYYSKYGFHGLEVNPYIFPSLYADKVKHYIDIFGKENVKIVFFEELIKNPEKVMQEILSWLGVEDDISKINLKENKNPYKKIRFSNLYNILNSNFFKLIKQSLPENVKDNLKNIMYKSVNKPKLEDDFKKELYSSFFDKDINKLSKILSIDMKKIWSI